MMEMQAIDVTDDLLDGLIRHQEHTCDRSGALYDHQVLAIFRSLRRAKNTLRLIADDMIGSPESCTRARATLMIIEEANDLYCKAKAEEKPVRYERAHTTMSYADLEKQLEELGE
jgi:hypothetical protein